MARPGVTGRPAMAIAPRRMRRSWRGAATVEMAIVLVLLLTLVFGAIEYGWMFMKAQEINGIARHGARVAAVSGAGHGDLENAVIEAMRRAGLDEAYVLETEPPDLDEVQSGEAFEVRLRLNYSHDENGVGLGMPLPRPGWLNARVTMVKEGT